MKGSRLVQIASEVVAATQRELPPEIVTVARDVPVLFEGRPGPDLLAEGVEPDILGLFSGAPHGSGETEPPQIYLYTVNLWEYAAGAFRDEVRLTYLHELGHFLGWDEDQIASRGLD
jgi:predicted Zn-dependent protease with MMP-like domain